MTTYSEPDIERLISCAKIISDPPRKEMRVERGSRRDDMRLRSQEGELEFSVFMRVNEDFPENFSIGLEYRAPDERSSICLLRCNGPHGEFVGGPESAHFLHHIHKAKPENIEAGLRAERGGEPTDAYASYLEALRYFLKVINVTNTDEYFPNLRQLPLNPEWEERKT
ncbi:MAG: hypothetical protein HYR72_10220 [Deltaproteobacteria bacterium]|nr:hypothetical protein [Deltaproteobacteria bacterium]MBI3388075.1 hypothetical protein [Deltaproteobacteria bacterium]